MTGRHVTDIDCQIAKLVRLNRARVGMSQTEVGESLGLTFQQIQKYEKGTNRIGAGRLFEIAALFNVPVQVLFPDTAKPVENGLDTKTNYDALSDLLLTADGRRLCYAFLKISDPKVRAKIIALVEEIGGNI